MLIPAKQHKKRKVYCVNCGYYIFSIYDSNDLCVSPQNVLLEYKDSYERKSVQTTYLRHPRAKNRSNNCPDYKLSVWWKIINTILALFRRGGGWNG